MCTYQINIEYFKIHLYLSLECKVQDAIKNKNMAININCMYIKPTIILLFVLLLPSYKCYKSIINILDKQNLEKTFVFMYFQRSYKFAK